MASSRSAATGDAPACDPGRGRSWGEADGDFHVDAVQNPDGTTLMVGGNLVASRVPLLVACLESSLRRGNGFVRLDLSRVRKVDEAAALALRLLGHVLDRSGSTLDLAAPSRLVTGALARCGLDIRPVEDALSAPRGGESRLAGVG